MSAHLGLDLTRGFGLNVASHVYILLYRSGCVHFSVHSISDTFVRSKEWYVDLINTTNGINIELYQANKLTCSPKKPKEL